MPNSPDVSICILGYNGGQVLERCIASALHGPSSLRTELLVIDNASADGSAERVAERFPDIRLVRNPRNLFFTTPYNRGFRETTGRYFLVLTQDVELGSDTLPSLVALMDANHKVGAVAPASFRPDGQQEPIAKREMGYGEMLLRYTVLGRLMWPLRNRLVRRNHYDGVALEGPTPVDVVQDSCLLVRRSAIPDGALYDERFLLYYNEDDLCIRLRRAGWDVCYFPGARVAHLGSHSGSPSRALMQRRINLQDALRFSAKYHGRLKTALLLAPLAYAHFFLWRTVRKVRRQ
ncbi:MAG: glycosyltransferase family 2 protein [Chloroflexi bacterium]|nr:glycosyltransferase family 2 protein [Chloroflexota bacterium]